MGHWKNLFGSVLAVMALSGNAAAQEWEGDSDAVAPRAGVVQLVNRSTQDVVLRFQRYLGADGRLYTLNGSVRLVPGSSVPVTVDGTPLRALRLDYTLESSAGQTSWTRSDDSSADESLVVPIDDVHLAYAGTLSGVAGGEEGQRERSFATVGAPQTVVFRATSLDGPAVHLQVIDQHGAVVAMSAQRGGTSSRCMLSTSGQEGYTLRVTGPGDTPVRFKVQITPISHGYVLGEAIGQEGTKALVGAALVSAFGDERDQRAFRAELAEGAQKDAIALAVIEGFVLLQRKLPAVDPLSLSNSTFADLARGDDDRLISVRRAFVDRLLGRVRAAAGG